MASNLELLRQIGQKIQSGETRWNTSVPAPPSSSTPSTPRVPTSTPVPAPPTGYSQQVRDSNFSKFQSDPNAKGMVYDDWLDKNIPKPQSVPAPTVNTAPTVPTSSVPSAPSVPAPPTPQNTIDTGRLQAEASAQIAKRRAALNQSVQSTLTGLKNSYDYSNQLKNDSRTLENVDFKRNTNPFSGKTDYLTAQMNRNRTIQDTAIDKDYQSNVAAAQQKLADFDTLAPEQTQALYNELLRIERQYGLDVGALMGVFQGERTLAGQQFDWGKTVDTANLTGTFQGQKTAAQANAERALGLQEKQANWGAYGDMVNWTGNLGTGPKSDWGNLVGQEGPSTMAGRQANLNAAIQVGNQTGRVIQPKSDWGNLYNQTDAPPNYVAQRDAVAESQWNRTYALDEADRAIKNRYTNAQISNMNNKQSGTSGSNSTKPDRFTLDDYKGLINQQFFGQRDEYGDPVQVDSGSLRNYIIMLNLDDESTDQLLRAYGLPTN